MRKVKRKYDSAHRKQLTGKTREQILESARRLFRDRGYGRVTIDDIAAAAAVAVPTVYATFGGKRAILMQLLDEMEKAADAPALVELLKNRAGDERARLRAFTDFSVRLFTEDNDLIRIAMLAGAADPDVAVLWETGDARRLAACRAVLEGCEQRGLLREGLTEARAVDILWALASAEFYGMFVRGRQWTPAQFADWLYQLAAEQLFRASPQPRA